MWSLLSDLEDFPCDFRALRAQAAATESAALTPLLAAAQTSAPRQTDILAERLVLAARAAAPAGFSEFLATWRLSGEEGRTLLALAEALLRIPDTSVADRLINDLLARGDWTPALAEASLRVKAAGWGLALGSRFIREEDLPGRWHRLLLKAGDAVLRPALAAGIRLLAEQFVMGETLAAALARRTPGLRYSFDCLGEAAQTQAEAERYAEAYLGAIRALAGQGEALPLPARDGISIKLSALHPRYEARQWPRLRDELLPRLVALLEEAAAAGIPVTLDAEESERLELQLAVFAALRQVPALRRWGGLGLAVQAYQKRAPAVLDWLAGEAARHGSPIPVRLVKGAYWDSEIKRAQLTGVAHYPVWTRKRHTDIAWQACARRLLAEPRAFWPQFATHNARSLAWLETTAANLGADYEVQRLAGMGEAVHEAFRQQCQRPLRIYAPVGAFHTLLPYLVRRLLENGSSQSFVNRLADPDTPLPALISDPVTSLGPEGVQPHPSLPEPQALYHDRPGSPGLDLADPQALLALREYCRQLPASPLAARPLLAAQAKARRDSRPCPAPANPARVLGMLTEASQADLALAMEQAQAAFPAWAARPVRERAELLYDWADALLEAREEFIALLVHEGGKTLGDAVAEWREAFDFCHYYAAEAERLLSQPTALPAVSGEANQLLLVPRGVFACISPWNFPLAIFVGQVAAALAAGNTVLAKPASQTPLVAWRAVQLALRAGIPAGVLQFVPASGRAISEVLLPHPALAGIAFTGSEPVAIELSRRLAARDGARLPLIAETGGLNALIADSSALPEQVVSDVLVSAFGSAGQRCSALRVLFVQDDIRSAVLERLKGALAEWRVDDPALVATDAGPVIDATARQTLEAVIDKWQPKARWMASADAPPGPGHFVAPHAFWLDRDDLPREEIFGPVLAIASFRHDELPAVVEWINRTGYGLTLGVHSRLDSTRDYLRRHARVGNLYENRQQTGAVVGCQPFGGEGRSGTGFKAGGPHYLLRFLSERTVTSNLSALGINTSLLDLGD